MTGPAPRFFATAAAFRAWLARNHATKAELLVGFYKKASGRPSMSWSESVDEALSFGWIDGKTRSLGDDAYVIRFTPRRPGSIWSRVNVAKIEALRKAGKLTEAGAKAFAARRVDRTAVYSFEVDPTQLVLPEEMAAALRADAKAHRDFAARPPWYRRAAIHWVTSAKKEETRAKRFATLLASSRAGRAVPPLDRDRGK